MPFLKFPIMNNTDETLRVWKRNLEYLFSKNLNDDNVSTTSLVLGANQVKESNIDWGLGADQVDAGDIPIIDASSYYSGGTVETALTQIGSTLLNIPAENVKIIDASSYFLSTSVEGALSELYSTISNIPSSNINLSFVAPLNISSTNIVLNYSTINLKIGTSSELDTIQDIHTTASPTFSNVSVDSIVLSTNVSTPSTTQGTIYWDNQDETVTAVMAGGNVKLQIGQEMYIRAVNKTGSEITNGSLVFVSGAQGNRPTIELANANNYTNANKTIGMVTENIAINGYGYVTISGLVRDLNTSTYIDGDCLYLSTNDGQYSTAVPSEGNARIRIGMVTKSHNTDGWICVKIDEDKYMFGDPDAGNYSVFESDGTLKFNGDASVWRDELQSLLLQNYISPVADIAINSSEGTVEFKQSCSLSDYTIMNVQINHDYKIGSELSPHLHWWQTSSNMPNWLIQYRWQYNGRTATTSWTNQAWTTNAATWTAGTLNQITDFGMITPTSDYTLSSILQLRLLRDGDNDSSAFGTTDLVSGTVSALNFDVHIELDTVGSRQEYIK